MFTIFQRIIALNCGLVVAVGLILALVVKDFLGEKFSAQHQDYGHSIAISLSEVITKSIIERRVLDTAQSLRRVAAESDNIRFLAVTDFDGKVFAHSFEGEIPDGLATFIKQSALDKKNVLDHISSVIPEISYHSQPLISGAAGRLHIGVDTAASEAAISDTGRTILLITLRMVPCKERATLVSCVRLTTTWLSSTDTLITAGTSQELSPFEPLTVTVDPATLTSTPEGIATGIIPILDIVNSSFENYQI